MTELDLNAEWHIGDAITVIKTLPDASVDLVLTSPPFLALRSYLPADHPDKATELGSEATPGAFVDALLDVIVECRRVLTPYGSLVVELGDTYSGSGGAGGDYNADGSRDGQDKFVGSARRGSGWPLAKSLTMIPELVRVSLAYGVNPLTGRTVEPWRIRNVIRWCLDGDTVVYARTPKGEGPTRLLHLTQNFKAGQWDLWNGTRWTPVLGWSTVETDNAIEIEFRNGERVSATREHEWPTQRGLIRTDELTVGDVIDSVRLPEPVRSAPSLLPDDDIGWLVGTFLADGSYDSRNRIQISGHIDETPVRLARLKQLAEAYDGTATAHHYENTASIVVRSPLLTATVRRYLGGDNARNKHLKAPTWRRSNEFLRALLTGYLEGDGHYDAKNDRWRLGFTDNPWLARDLRVICARLGVSCRVRRQHRKPDPRGGSFAGTASFAHRGTIRLNPGPRVKSDSEIVALRISKRRRFFDVGVEGEPHLFALGSGILTHNCRPNPPVGALGDKFRPGTSDMLVACVAKDRFFDLDAVREPYKYQNHPQIGKSAVGKKNAEKDGNWGTFPTRAEHPGGAPPLDWWRIPTQGFKGSHYATWPKNLLVKPILTMCPEKVCNVCGEPSRRIAETTNAIGEAVGRRSWRKDPANIGAGHTGEITRSISSAPTAERVTLGWTNCGHGDWRRGIVLDPFAGSGTTLEVATGYGRSCIGIDLDERNAVLAERRVGMFLTVV